VVVERVACGKGILQIPPLRFASVGMTKCRVATYPDLFVDPEETRNCLFRNL
jgi:hypothetical protein